MPIGHYQRHRNPQKKSIFVCKWCGTSFQEWAYRKPQYCSKQCVAEFAARQPKPTTRVPAYHVIQTCAQCGKEYETNRIQILLRHGKYCSRQCQYKARSIAMRGDKHPLWKGGGSNYRGDNWCSQARKARHRDNYTCQICSYKYDPRKPRKTDVHHIIPYREFDGDWKSANNLFNLIVLCRLCHRKAELGKISCPRKMAI